MALQVMHKLMESLDHDPHFGPMHHSTSWSACISQAGTALRQCPRGVGREDTGAWLFQLDSYKVIRNYNDA